MSHAGCSRPLDPTRLLEFWLRELGAAADARVEAHLLACADCSRSLQDLLDLGAAVRACIRRGTVRAVVNDTFVWRLMAAGLRVREYRVPRDGSVQCTVAPEDDIVVARLGAPLGGVTRLDVVMMDVEGEAHEVLDDVPFDAEAGELVIAPDIEQLRALPASTAKVQLVAVEEQARRVIGEYTFVHTPWGQS